MSQTKPYKDDPQSYRSTGIPRGNVARYNSGDVMVMSGPRKQSNVIEPVETETKKELRELAKRQADTDITLACTLKKQKQFIGSTTHQPLKDGLQGEMSLNDYQTIADKDEQYEQLRMLGLTDEEIAFKMEHESKDFSQPSKLGMDPSIIISRLKEIKKKIKTKEDYFKQKDQFKPRKVLTRHEMDLEKSLIPNDPISAKIGHLLVTSEHQSEGGTESNEIKDLLKEIESASTEKTVSEEVKEQVVKCVRCHQIDILVKYGHREKPGPSDCADCEHIQRMEKLKQDCTAITDENVNHNQSITSQYNESSNSSKANETVTSVDCTNSNSKKKESAKAKTAANQECKETSSLDKANPELSAPKTISSCNSSSSKDPAPCVIGPMKRGQLAATVNSKLSAPKTISSCDPSTSTDPCVIGPLRRGQLAWWTHHEEIEEIPQRVLERYRLTLKEIKMIPRFANYTPGEPSKTLFVKNLSHKVSEEDLVSMFRRFEKSGPLTYKLMTGRMKGQAFVSFPDEETATAALHLVNGYMFKDKPIIIQYGRKA